MVLKLNPDIKNYFIQDRNHSICRFAQKLAKINSQHCMNCSFWKGETPVFVLYFWKSFGLLKELDPATQLQLRMKRIASVLTSASLPPLTHLAVPNRRWSLLARIASQVAWPFFSFHLKKSTISSEEAEEAGRSTIRRTDSVTRALLLAHDVPASAHRE